MAEDGSSGSTKRRRAEHGNRSRYVDGCRCAECREANRLYHESRRRKAGVKPLQVGPQTGHGTVARYGRGCRCERCCAANTERHRRWRQQTPRKQKSNIAAMAAFRQQRREFVDSLKLAQGCVDCGFSAHPAALHFDHIDSTQKSGHISRLYTARMDRLMAEIAKCEVVCANCHAIRTAARGYSGGWHAQKRNRTQSTALVLPS